MQKNTYSVISKGSIVMFFITALVFYLFMMVPQFLSGSSYSYSESLLFYFTFINPLTLISVIVKDGKFIFSIYLSLTIVLLLLSVSLFVISIKSSRVLFVVLTHISLLIHFLLILALPFVAMLFYPPN